jgi:FkbM family methyltransferase
MEIKKQFKKVKKKVSGLFKVNKILSGKEKRRLENLGRFQPTNISFYGKKIKVVDAPTFLSSYEEIFVSEIYKFTSNKKKITIIDCGANIGLATIYFKMNFPDANILSFEPDPAIFSALKQNIDSFGYSDIICKNEAVSDKDNFLDFWSEGGHSGMITNKTGIENAVKVKATRLKSILKTYEQITFLKIDIEGEEVNVIPDIADELKKVDYLFLEYHSFLDSAQNLDTLLGFITQSGMRYYIKEAANKTFPFLNREIFLNMDMLVNIFCYREN